jgi:cell division protein FtsQ
MDRPTGRDRRLAQPLTGGASWLAAPRRGLARAQRLARRALAPLIELEIPRGAGALGAALLVVGSVGYGVSAGGHVAEIASEVRHACDALANGAGLRIAAVALSGDNEVGRAAILDLAGIDDDSSLLCLDAALARQALTRNPWIAEASVLKLYPGRLQIGIRERTPLALWQKDGRVFVIAADGTVLENFNGRFATLPLVVGEGAASQARDFLDIVGRYPLLRDAIEACVLVAQRRWNLRLKSGIDVRLPDSDVEQALQTLVALDRDKKILSRDITAIDLRLPDRVIVRLSDDAAAGRAEAVKEMLKKDKAKKKGSEA